jgi:hypothetical protein
MGVSSGKTPFPFRDLLRPDLQARFDLFSGSLDAYHAKLDVIEAQGRAGSVSVDDVKEAFGLAKRALTELGGMEQELEKRQMEKGDIHGDDGVVLYHLQVFAGHFREAHETYRRELQSRYPHLKFGDG